MKILPPSVATATGSCGGRGSSNVAKRAETQATSDLALEAATRCLQSAGVAVDQVDLILVATMTPDHPTPSTACHLQRRLGGIAPAMDVNAACAGFMFGLVTAAQFVATGAAQQALVVGADLMSRIIDPGDKKTYPLFGDAAGAALLSADHASLHGDDEPASGLLAYTLGSEGCGGEMLCVPSGGSRQTPSAEVYPKGCSTCGWTVAESLSGRSASWPIARSMSWLRPV